VVRRDPTLVDSEDSFGSFVVAVVGIDGCVEDRRVDEDRQLACSIASAT